ncbi:unnamed protein product [marine sediment metagenome]|uniref:Uncharacterized protein n=1 Tax=marine sediment metagenome TaxID=412755 RepID=X0WCC0_9ZZZZ
MAGGVIIAGELWIPGQKLISIPSNVIFTEHKVFTMAYTITEEVVEDGLYGEIGDRYAWALAQSMDKTREMVINEALA